MSAGSGTQRNSQIDFVLARHADSQARQARPILSTIPYPKAPRGKPQQPVLTMTRVRDACLRLPELLPAFSVQVSQVHADQPHLGTATLLATAWPRALAQKPQLALSPTHSQSLPLAAPLESLWALRKKVRGVTLQA